jgi:hypothetical protein
MLERIVRKQPWPYGSTSLHLLGETKESYKSKAKYRSDLQNQKKNTHKVGYLHMEW